MDNREKLKELFSILDELDVYNRSIEKLDFDIQCCAPADGMELAGNDMAVLGKHIYDLTHSDKYSSLVTELHEDHEGLTALEVKAVEYCYEDYAKIKNFTPEFSFEMESAIAKAYGCWLDAKKSSNFSLFRDSFASVVDYTRKAIQYRDKQPSTIYNACLDDFEKGGNETQLDAFFTTIRERTVPLIRKIVQEGKPIRDDFLTRSFPIPQQESFSRYLLTLEGLKESSLVLMTTEHPFTTNFGPKDVRVTTHYFENLFLSNIFTILHEGGHALFMQYEPQEFYDNHVADHMSNAMHECISRFYENIIGRSEAFIHFIYPKLQEISPLVMEGVSERELYEGVNISRPSLIRTDADELTYCLHILIRYEIEKELVNGRICVDDVPSLWNAKYKEYLGIDVPDDARGCLQDVHWCSGFGYFPSYALGNAYGAQILNTMLKDFDVFAEVSEGHLEKILTWLKEHVFNCSSIMDPDEWIQSITGESLNPDYYLTYLEKKYTSIYGLS